MRGYAAIGLWRPKNPANIGGALRAAYIYDARLVCIAWEREWERPIRHPADTPRTWRHVPVQRSYDLRSLLPFDCTPIGVDLVDGAIALPEFVHPQRAFYIFGPEDGTLGDSVLSWCAYRVYVPTKRCMNLAATVNVVLYDRLSKHMNNETYGAAGHGLAGLGSTGRSVRGV